MILKLNNAFHLDVVMVKILSHIFIVVCNKLKIEESNNNVIVYHSHAHIYLLFNYDKKYKSTVQT